MRGRRVTFAACIAIAALGAGCGGSDAPEAEAAPDDCLALWNAEDVALAQGRHAFDAHGVQRAQVAKIAAPEAENVRTEETCSVFFAVSEGDAEFGTLGLVITRFGWSQLFELGLGEDELERMQRSASEEANANVFPDGSLDAG